MNSDSKEIEMTTLEEKLENGTERDKLRDTGTTSKSYAEERTTPTNTIIFLAEILGTGILVFLGCMGTCVPSLIKVPVAPHFAGIGFGWAVLIAIQAVGHISGAHLNPQVTIAAYISGNIKLKQVFVYWAGEFIGGLLGFGLLKLVSPNEHLEGYCETLPHENVSNVKALIIEIIITFILIVICCSIWDSRNAKNTDSVPLRFGFVIAGICIVAGPLSGASMNTARSFAPAIINGQWNYQWIYWIGPTIGSIIASIFYNYILTPPYK